MKNVFSFLFFLALVFLVQYLSMKVTNIETLDIWYASLEKPPLTPPNWVFSVVWPILYLLIAISGYGIFSGQATKRRSQALLFWIGQLLLNALWTILFFQKQAIALAAIEILILWTTILATIFLAWPVKRYASACLVPYFLWVSFAMYLNMGFAFLH